MSQHDDSSFFRTFGVILGALVVFTVLIAVIANVYSPGIDRASDPLVQQEQARQIAPVGQSRVQKSIESAAEEQTGEVEVAAIQPVITPAEEAESEDAEGAASEDAQSDGSATAEQSTSDSAAVAASMVSDAEIPVRVKAVVATNCAGCHRDGLKGAQLSDDAEAWQALDAKGLETLTASVINGKGAMLPRAETTLTDEEITLAIRHMIAQSVGDDAAGATEGDSAQTSESQADTGSDAAGTESDAQTDDSPAAEESETDAADTDAAAGESASAEASAEAETAVVAATEIPASVKGVVDGLCAGCHISGVANAPKYGDKAAWDERLSMGMDKLLASAIAGKGAMPARGGSQLSDAELRLAIEYMASK